MLKLFTTPSCTQCPIVIDALDGLGTKYEIINAEDKPHLAAEYGVMSVPTLVGEDGELYIGTGACLTYLNGVNSLGETLYDSLLVGEEKKLDGTVYLAGDLLSEGAKMRREWEASQLRKAGATLHVPHEDASINDKANAVQDGLAERIVANDTQGIIDSDVIVIDAHENGKGTLVELGQIKGMKDMAETVLHTVLGVTNGVLSERAALDMIQADVESVLEKKVYAHNTDIRRANTQQQAGDRREYAPNQYVYGTVLELTDGKGFFDWDEIMEELKTDE